MATEVSPEPTEVQQRCRKIRAPQMDALDLPRIARFFWLQIGSHRLEVSNGVNIFTGRLKSSEVNDKGEEGKHPYETIPTHVKTNGEQMSIGTSSMICSHSVSGDLHGVQSLTHWQLKF